MSDFKLAADAIRSLAEWKDRAVKAETKVAAFERKERVSTIIEKAARKSAVLPKDVDLMKCSEDKLESIERALDLIGPRGDIKLGSAEEDDSVSARSARRLSELDEYCLNPQGSGL